MKIALTTPGEVLDSVLDQSFGRAANFMIYDLESQSFEIVGNLQNSQAAQGAGIQAAQTIIKAGVAVLITGHCGPKAFRVLDAGGVKVFNTDAPTVRDALARYQEGRLEQARAANVEGHWA